MIYRTRSEEDTIELGRTLSAGLSGVVLLIGNLGAGKTTLAKGIVLGRHAASPDEVSSPTFTLIHEYGAGPAVYHIDLYRLDDERAVETLGLRDIFDDVADRGALVLIEWGERFPALIPAERTEIRLHALSEDEREIAVSYMGDDRSKLGPDPGR